MTVKCFEIISGEDGERIQQNIAKMQGILHYLSKILKLSKIQPNSFKLQLYKTMHISLLEGGGEEE